jgi:hypothetical protein
MREETDIAGLGDSAVLCELTNEDGAIARMPEIIAFAEKHDMTVVSIEDIRQYKRDFHKIPACVWEIPDKAPANPSTLL